MSNEDDKLEKTIKKIYLNRQKPKKNQKSKNSKTTTYTTSYSRNLDGYVRPEVTKQDEISSDPEQVKARFVGFTRITKDEYQYIKPGTYIRYLKALPDGKYQYCVGGRLYLNKSPDYWMLRNTIYGNRNRTWSVQLKSENIYYKRDNDIEEQLPEEMINEIYKYIKSGEYRLIKTDDLKKLLKNVNDEDETFSIIDINSNNTKKNISKHDENDKNTEESYEKSYDEESSEELSDESSEEPIRRPTTLVELV